MRYLKRHAHVSRKDPTWWAVLEDELPDGRRDDSLETRAQAARKLIRAGKVDPGRALLAVVWPEDGGT